MVAWDKELMSWFAAYEWRWRGRLGRYCVLCKDCVYRNCHLRGKCLGVYKGPGQQTKRIWLPWEPRFWEYKRWQEQRWREWREDLRLRVSKVNVEYAELFRGNVLMLTFRRNKGVVTEGGNKGRNVDSQGSEVEQLDSKVECVVEAARMREAQSAEGVARRAKRSRRKEKPDMLVPAWGVEWKMEVSGLLFGLRSLMFGMDHFFSLDLESRKHKSMVVWLGLPYAALDGLIRDFEAKLAQKNATGYVVTEVMQLEILYLLEELTTFCEDLEKLLAVKRSRRLKIRVATELEVRILLRRVEALMIDLRAVLVFKCSEDVDSVPKGSGGSVA